MQIRISAAGTTAKAPAIPPRRAQFANVYEAYASRVYGFVFSHVGNREDAEDITSQVFIKAYKSLDGFAGKGPLENWLFQIAPDYRDRFLATALQTAGWQLERAG